MKGTWYISYQSTVGLVFQALIQGGLSMNGTTEGEKILAKWNEIQLAIARNISTKTCDEQPNSGTVYLDGIANGRVDWGCGSNDSTEHPTIYMLGYKYWKEFTGNINPDWCITEEPPAEAEIPGELECRCADRQCNWWLRRPIGGCSFRGLIWNDSECTCSQRGCVWVRYGIEQHCTVNLVNGEYSKDQCSHYADILNFDQVKHITKEDKNKLECQSNEPTSPHINHTNAGAGLTIDYATLLMGLFLYLCDTMDWGRWLEPQAQSKQQPPQNTSRIKTVLSLVLSTILGVLFGWIGLVGKIVGTSALRLLETELSPTRRITYLTAYFASVICLCSLQIIWKPAALGEIECQPRELWLITSICCVIITCYVSIRGIIKRGCQITWHILIFQATQYCSRGILIGVLCTIVSLQFQSKSIPLWTINRISGSAYSICNILRGLLLIRYPSLWQEEIEIDTAGELLPSLIYWWC
jgi:hypothetical protein